jgi:hypothetical protein
VGLGRWGGWQQPSSGRVGEALLPAIVRDLRGQHQADAKLTQFWQDGRLPRMPLERRLVPINAFIGLCDPSPPWPSTLADAGFRLTALEVPVVTEAGTVTLDGVAHSRATDELLVVECKSGANIEEDQARRLATVQAASVVRSAAISLATPAAPQVEVIYLCLEEDTERIVMGSREGPVAGRRPGTLHDASTHGQGAFDLILPPGSLP